LLTRRGFAPLFVADRKSESGARHADGAKLVDAHGRIERGQANFRHAVALADGTTGEGNELLLKLGGNLVFSGATQERPDFVMVEAPGDDDARAGRKG